MVKRQAEKQLTDRNWNDQEPDDTPSTGALKTASLQAISKRQIRSLPKKTGASASPAASQFGAVPPFPAISKPASTLFSQPSQSVQPTPSLNLFGSSSSFGAAKPTSFGSAPLAMSTSSSSTEPPNTEALFDYYASLRGLNLCATKAFDELITKDAFVDLSSAFDHVKQKYNEHRREIQAKLERVQPSTTDKASISSTAEAPAKSLFSFGSNGAQKASSIGNTSSTAEAPVKSPFSFASNGAPKASSTANTSSTAEAAVKSPFSFASNGAQKASGTERLFTSLPFCPPERLSVSESEQQLSPDETEKTSLPSTNGSAAPDGKAGSRPGAFTMAAPMRPSPLRYESQNSPAASPAPESAEEAAKNPSSLAPIAELSKPESSLSLNAETGNPQPKSKEPNSDGSSPTPLLFSDSKNKASSLFGAAGASAAGNSLFGSSSASNPFNFGSSSSQNSPPKSSSLGFGFGVGAAGSSGVFGGFGSPKNASNQATPSKNAFNPVGFSFGGSPPTSSAMPTKTSEAVPSQPGSTTNNSNSNLNDKPNTSSDNVPENETKSSDDLVTTTEIKAIDSKKGEEEEETLFETTGRVYALLDKKQEDGKIQKSWVGWAISTVKLNRHKVTQRCRILARSQVNQSILINFYVRPNLKPENRGNAVEVLGFNPEGTHLQAYRIRPSSVQVVEEFLKAIKGVVESLSES
ncbi:hypothetical protein PTTG_04702 [Puccinia triticina 1-1 BBBD Race 1]|uniref:RanBD1 domain-containing protein n=2 Tax=Puccinia triticina TaxID=208348 RepID=A0A0C4EV70_PUCT1|nr:uncharacterized protein PtA15_1A401 [Puccinia triticina]OAV91185.1 hypothetical protein PTTG_04702 [Puccinia triticina 1-1 BBBD Race 1]WAQ81063.1 hypothetical protein PtA15_1A401 [Puccinia triticina]WAR51956.1 hypothetical protein PtB15_1B393 [Puccinia triticina]